MKKGGSKPANVRPCPDIDVAGLLAQKLDLIPLHRADYVDPKGRQRGKSPRDNNWRRRTYTKAELKQAVEQGHNLGVRLRADQLVIDVDPRHFEAGDELDRFCADLGVDPEACPRTRTGSGGWHIYLTKPAAIRLRDSLPEYKGIELKSEGRQVVAPGSIHPDGGAYELFPGTDDDFRDVGHSDAPEASVELVERATRPSVAESPGGRRTGPGKVISGEQLGSLLAALDARDFREHDRWLNLAMACSAATDGEGLDEFREWCWGDPDFAGDGRVASRWDTFDPSKPGGVTHRTLLKILLDAGVEPDFEDEAFGEAMRLLQDDGAPAADDFEGVEDPGGDEEAGPTSPLEALNAEFTYVKDGARVYTRVTTPLPRDQREERVGLRPRTRLQAHSVSDFRNNLLNRPKLQKGDKAIRLADAWLEWPGRSEAEGLTFDPSGPAGIADGWLNTWDGWAVDPRPGDWSLAQELVRDVICAEDESGAAYEYVLNWMAHMFQRPGRPGQVIVAVRGEKGVGKGAFGRILLNLAGSSAMYVSDLGKVTGRFNAHLKDKVFVFLDEATQTNDKAAQGALKALTTEGDASYEGKGKDVEAGGFNMVHGYLATNERFVAPMTAGDERRWFVTTASDRRQGDTEFFLAMWRQLGEGGYAAMLHDLLARNLSGWDPQRDMPTTDTMREQVGRYLTPVQGWVASWLEGGLPFETYNRSGLGAEWEDGGARTYALKDDVLAAFRAWAEDNGMGRHEVRNLGQDLKVTLGQPAGFGQGRIKAPEDRPDLAPPPCGDVPAYKMPPREEVLSLKWVKAVLEGKD